MGLVLQLCHLEVGVCMRFVVFQPLLWSHLAIASKTRG